MQWTLGGALQHAECLELIVDYVAGTLDSRKEPSFERHIEFCAPCARVLAEQRVVWAALDEWRGLLPVPAVNE